MIDEETPLIQQAPEPYDAPLPEISNKRPERRRLQHPRTIGLVCVLLLFMAIGGYKLIKSTGQVFLDAARLDLTNVRVANVTDDGFEVVIRGDLEFDYDQVNLYRRTWGRLLSGLNAVQISPDGPFDMNVCIKKEKLCISSVELLKPLTVRLRQPQTIEAVALIKPTKEMARLINPISRGPEKVVFSCSVVCGIDVNGHSMGQHTVAGALALELDGGRIIRSVMKDAVPENLEINADGRQVTGFTVVRLSSVGLVDYTADAMSWEVLMAGCSKVSSVATIRTGKFGFHDPILIPTEFTVHPLDEDLLLDCGDGSAISKLLTNFSSNLEVPIIVRAKPLSTQPHWMRDIFDDLEIDAALAIGQIDELGGGIDAVDIEYLGVRAQGDALLVSSDVSIKYNISESITVSDIDIPFVKGEVHCGPNITTLEMRNWQASKLHCKKQTFGVSLDEAVLKPEDSNLIRDLVQNVASGTSVKIPIRPVLDIQVVSEFMTTTISGLSTELEYAVPGVPNDQLFRSLGVRLNELVLLESSAKHCAMVINAAVSTNVNLDSTLEGLRFDLQYNGSIVGRIEPGPVHLSPENYSNTSAKLIMQLDTDIDKSRLERMLGTYLSGLHPTIELIGRQDSQLAAFVAGIRVPMRLPQISRQENLPHPVSHESIFLIDSTMHIMSSEIELTVFNPVANSEVVVDLIEAQASHDKTILGYISKEQRIVVPPGLYRTPRIPVTYATSGIGADILRKALNGQLEIDTSAVMRVRLGAFAVELLYSGSGTSTKIRL
ncbi:hypothetical protein KL937_003263 [Ogataea polymorpha]|nr:hypothetical protein KL937_003263 [Ogataea polymorpha]KAG7935110.1 hypothetical protein KL904_003442 [Ogataea polymorpha]